jgi:AcrR family transcriptional regulator
MAGRRTDTRQRVMRVALELFSEQGYDRTSLRQIADRLQITKAALYYHFKTKEDLLEGILGDFAVRLTELVAWGREHPAAPETRAELLRRYGDLITEGAGILQDNSFQEFHVAAQIREQIFALFGLLAEPDPTSASLLRAQLAIAALHIGLAGGGFARPQQVDPQLGRTAFDVALDLVNQR